MKRTLGSSDSLGAFMSICANTPDEEMMSERSSANLVYSGGQEVLASIFEGCVDEEDIGGHVAEKKRRLGVEQVKALEKNFEMENKLEPERKVKLAQELGLQPRQVAIWFQNRRARWKTKQLERDYGVLKSNYDALKRNRDALQRDNHTLLQQIKELRAQLNIEDTERSHNNNSVKEEETLPSPPQQVGVADHGVPEITHHRAPPILPTELEYEMFNIFPRGDSFKEGPADSSDSSAVLNEEYHSPTAAAAAAEMTIGCFGNFVKMEEHGDLFTGEEACKLFADDEQWYCSDQWKS